ncbi:E3 SUMO-protein ligase ZBED1, partial [Frankliniella fusca]
MSSHLGVVAHFHEGLKVRTIEIAARPMPESKTAQNIQVALREICQEWNIDYANVRGIVTDGGANIKNAVRNEFGCDKHIECITHKINNIGQAALGLKETKVPSEHTFDDFMDEATDIPEDEEQAIDLLDDLNEETDDSLSTTQMRPLVMRVKKIVRFFRKREVATSELIALQEAEGKQRHECRKLIQEVRTRWNSTFEMVDRKASQVFM